MDRRPRATETRAREGRGANRRRRRRGGRSLCRSEARTLRTMTKTLINAKAARRQARVPDRPTARHRGWRVALVAGLVASAVAVAVIAAVLRSDKGNNPPAINHATNAAINAGAPPGPAPE